MAFAHSADYKRKDLSQLDYTYDLLSSLTDDELEVIQQVAIGFINKKTGNTSDDETIPFQSQTEEQFFVRIDRALEEVGAGLGEDLEDVYAEMMVGLDEVVQSVGQAKALIALNSMRRKAVAAGFKSDDEIESIIAEARGL